jgi:hypothetical protein
LFGRCQRKNSIAAFHRLVGQVMRREPYRSARRVFLITDNGSCHRGRRAADRLHTKWVNIILVHTLFTPVGSIKLEGLLLDRSAEVAHPEQLQQPGRSEAQGDGLPGALPAARQAFKWTFTRRDLHALLVKLQKRLPCQEIAALECDTVIANQGT